MPLRRVLVSLAGGAAVMVALSFIAFSVVRFAGDPVEALMSPSTSAADVRNARQTLGLDEPLSVQYATFAANLLKGDLGISLRQRLPVATMLLERVPATFELAFIATLISMACGMLLGLYASVQHRGRVAQAIMTLSVIGIAVPTFLLAIILVWIFSIELGWLPAFGRGETVAIGWWSTGC